MRRTGMLGAGLLGAALVLSSCASTSSLRPSDVEDQISQGLSTQVGGEFAVSCPSSLPAESGYTFTCAVTDRTDGTTSTVTVVEDDDTGAFTWKVTAPSPG